MVTQHGDQGDALTVREAAAVAAVAPRAIRRKLSEGAFPNAFAVSGEQGASEGRWRIPVVDLEHAGFTPRVAARTNRPST